MELQPSVIFAIEIIGTIAFASSGAMVAVRKKAGFVRDYCIGCHHCCGRRYAQGYFDREYTAEYVPQSGICAGCFSYCAGAFHAFPVLAFSSGKPVYGEL